MFAAALAGQSAISCFHAAEAEAASSIRLVPVVSGMASPLFITHAGDGSGRFFIIEQAGRIRILANGQLLTRPFLDITNRVLSGGERGLLGLAFHPQYRSNGRFFVNYTRKSDGATVVAEYKVSGNANVAQTSGRVLLTVAQPFPNHNGGMLAFGPDGRLYIALGDGGSAGDPGNRAQNPNQLLGKILRIDVNRGRPYGIPADNPFANGGGKREIFALGFRNPWRFSFDRGTGQLYAGDVGQGEVEEVDIVRRGGNYGWRIMEGDRCYQPASGCNRNGLVLPIATYTHDSGNGDRCSITGGYVYRGQALSIAAGTYVFADFCSGEIFGLNKGQFTVLLDTNLQIVSFGEDPAGELFVIDRAGGIHRIAAP